MEFNLIWIRWDILLLLLVRVTKIYKHEKYDDFYAVCANFGTVWRIKRFRGVPEFISIDEHWETNESDRPINASYELGVAVDAFYIENFREEYPEYSI